jgi:DNA-binding beta-propeller fold protein YncE
MKPSSRGRITWRFGFLVLSTLATGFSAADGYHLLKKVTLGGEGGWDYITVDASSRRVYLSHRDHVNVVDADNGTVVGDISGMHLVHSITPIKELGRGFISDGSGPTALGGGDRVVMFDLKTLKALGEIKAGANPDCMIYDPVSRHIFAFNKRGKNLSVIDPVHLTLVATVPMGGIAEHCVADGKGIIYDNIEDTNEVVALDSRALTVKARWPVAPAAAPAALAMDREHRRLFIGGRNKVLAIMDADNGKVIQSFPIGAVVDANVYEPSTGLVFSSTGEGTLHIFHEDSPNTFSVVQTVYTQPGARTMGLDPKTHNLFLTTADFGPLPAPTAENPNPQPTILPGTFVLLVYGR